MDRRNKPVKWSLLVLLALALILTVLPFLPGLSNGIVVSPSGYLYLFFLGLDYDLWWLGPVLCLLPLLGWLLLHRGIAKGKWVINTVYGLLLGGNVLVFCLHFVTTIGSKNLQGLGLTVLLGLSCLCFSIPILVLTNRWYPRISYK